MLNNFESLQHINQFDFQAAESLLSENLNLYRDQYETKEDFVSYANSICNQFDDNRLSEEDNKAIAAIVWDEENPAENEPSKPPPPHRRGNKGPAHSAEDHAAAIS